MASLPTYSEEPAFWDASVPHAEVFRSTANGSPEFMAFVEKHAPSDVSDHPKVSGEEKTAIRYSLPAHIRKCRVEHTSLIVRMMAAASAVTDRTTLVRFFLCTPPSMKIYFIQNKALPYELLAEIVRADPVGLVVTAALAQKRHVALLLQDFEQAIEARRSDAPDIVDHLYYLKNNIYSNVS